MQPLSSRKNAGFFIHDRAGELPELRFDKKKILGKWYIRETAKWLTRLYCGYHHFNLFRIRPERNIGHVIYGLFRKA